MYVRTYITLKSQLSLSLKLLCKIRCAHECSLDGNNVDDHT